MKLGGLDIGTTSCKICIYEQDGQYVETIEQEYQTSLRKGVDTDALWDAVQSCLRRSAKHKDLSAIGVTSFGETCVLLDAQDRPLMQAMLYTDPRGEEEAKELSDEFGEYIQQTTGLSPSGMYSLPKMMWLRKNRPDLWINVSYIPEIQDYVVYRLTGQKQVDYSLASRTMAFDVRRCCWDQKILAWAGIDCALLSTPVPSGTIAGAIYPDLARQFGFASAVSVVSAAHDQAAAMVGAGALTLGAAVDGAGTVQCLTPVYKGFPRSKGFFDGKFSVVPYLKPDQFISYAFSFTGGALLKWFRDNIAEASADGSGFYEATNTRMPLEPTGLLVLPHFAGAGTPYMDADARGAIVGLNLGVDRPTMYKALMEGVAYEMRINLEMLRKCNIDIRRLYATGGGSRSPEWLQIKADILGIPITRLRNEQCGAVGSIMLTGCAIGLFACIDEASRHFVQQGETFSPHAVNSAVYDKLFARYRRLYSAMKEVWL